MTHVGNHLRTMLYGYMVESGEVDLFELTDPSVAGSDPLRWLTGQLWNCTDIMPAEMRARCVLAHGRELSSYGQAARAIRAGALVP